MVLPYRALQRTGQQLSPCLQAATGQCSSVTALTRSGGARRSSPRSPPSKKHPIHGCFLRAQLAGILARQLGSDSTRSPALAGPPAEESAAGRRPVSSAPRSRPQIDDKSVANGTGPDLGSARSSASLNSKPPTPHPRTSPALAPVLHPLHARKKTDGLRTNVRGSVRRNPQQVGPSIPSTQP